MNKILTHFQKHDLVLHTHAVRLWSKIKIPEKEKPENYFFKLCREIIGQQLSSQSGAAIFARFLKLFPSGVVNPTDILSLSHEQLRAVGMSNAKARYVRNLAENLFNNTLHLNRLDEMPNNEVVEELTKVKGIGPWTAEMFLIFTLGREDVFSFGDLGLKKGLMKIYGFKKEPTKKQIEKLISKWTPYKSYASLTLWAVLDE